MNSFSFTEKELYEIVEILQLDSDIEEVIRKDYSGRGMWGRECLGFVVPANKIAALGAAIMDTKTRYIDDEDERECMVDDVNYLMSNSAIDNLGLDMIVYFPGVTVE